MPEPSVVAILLTANRPEMTQKAVECFRARTMKSAWLQILDTGEHRCREVLQLGDRENIRYATHSGLSGKTIGEIRNEINSLCPEEVLIHWDSDDYSHPSRISEQVALLQSSASDVVGYNEVLFWREPRTVPISVAEIREGCCTDRIYPGEAWLYTGNPQYPVGSSLCYWRRTWEAKPFAATSQGEDEKFVRGLKVKSLSVFDNHNGTTSDPQWPALLCRIHPGNTSTAYEPHKMQQAAEWRRVPEWDNFCRSEMCASI